MLDSMDSSKNKAASGRSSKDEAKFRDGFLVQSSGRGGMIAGLQNAKGAQRRYAYSEGYGRK